MMRCPTMSGAVAVLFLGERQEMGRKIATNVGVECHKFAIQKP